MIEFEIMELHKLVMNLLMLVVMIVVAMIVVVAITIMVMIIMEIYVLCLSKISSPNVNFLPFGSPNQDKM